MLEAGLIVFIGFLFIWVKMPRSWQRWTLEHALTTDIVVAVLAYTIHWGSFLGVMAAAIAGMLVSMFTSIMKRVNGIK
jgi:hypothetical protein